jgi:hypothetical protein
MGAPQGMGCCNMKRESALKHPKFAASEGISVTMSSQAPGNISISSTDRGNVYSAEDILRGLGDPREHVDIKASYDLTLLNEGQTSS